jgi:hypothetical protein
MYQKLKLAAAAVFLLLHTQQLKAQTISNSPYSRFGIGEINPEGFVRNIGMGNTGVAAPSTEFVNIINPALLYYNRLTTFEAGIDGNGRILSDANARSRTGNMNLGYLAFSFPVHRKATVTAALRPYSGMNYNIRYADRVMGATNTEVGYILSGSGNTNQVLLGTGIELFKGFSVGLQGSYLFGTLVNESSAVLLPEIDNAFTVRGSSTRINDFLLKGGLSYRKAIIDKENFMDDVFMNIGATYERAGGMDATLTRTVSQRLADGTPLFTDSTFQQSVSGQIQIPASYRFGIGFDRPYHWSVAADVSTQDWTTYRDFRSATNFTNYFAVGVGGEFIPNINALGGGFGDYMARATYRAGLSYTQSPLLVNERQINDFGINFGFSFPVNRNLSNINLGLTLGQRGTTEGNLVREQYIRFKFGFTFNDRWFVRGKID